MEGKIGDFILSLCVKIYHDMESLSKTEYWAQKDYFLKLDGTIRKKTKRPLIIGIVGLIGSGKTTIAKEISPLIGATVISVDDIRVCLRKQGEKYDSARLIAENAAMTIINNKDGNVIIDSDFINQKKRVSLKEKAKIVGAKVIFIRTYADLDVMIGRIMDADYKNIPEDFFGGASSSYQGENKGAIVKEREMICRILSHYNAVNTGNGRYKFELKKLPFKVFAEIDTSNENKWKQEVKMVAGQIRSCY